MKNVLSPEEGLNPAPLPLPRILLFVYLLMFTSPQVVLCPACLQPTPWTGVPCPRTPRFIAQPLLPSSPSPSRHGHMSLPRMALAHVSGLISPFSPCLSCSGHRSHIQALRTRIFPHSGALQMLVPFPGSSAHPQIPPDLQSPVQMTSPLETLLAPEAQRPPPPARSYVSPRRLPRPLATLS